MKNLIKFLGIVFVLIEMMGCKPEPEPQIHVHTFSEEWSFDETYHWNAATCNHSDEVMNRAEHIWNEGEVTKEVTENEDGEKIYKCTVCQKKKLITTSFPLQFKKYMVPIDYETGKNATQKSTYVLYGMFPKTVLPLDSTVTVDETDIIKMGANTYYKGSDGEYYAKVRENPIYPPENSEIYTDGTQTQYDRYRYFKVEPIRWKQVNFLGGSIWDSLLIAEDILMGNIPYYENDLDRTIDGKIVYPNNYMHSQIRAYLNGLSYQGQNGVVTKWNGNGFLQTAFTPSAQSKIYISYVDNGAESNRDYQNEIPEDYVKENLCETTKDKVFLLSEYEVTHPSHGFGDSISYGEESGRIRRTTDYAKANYAGNDWMLRSPELYMSTEVCSVSSDGRVYERIPWDPPSILHHIISINVYKSYVGIVPAMRCSLPSY